MRIRSFNVQGFANFTNPVSLGPLQEVNVLYGPSNAGKSNFLKAVELYFRLLGVGETVTKLQPQIIDRPDEALLAATATAFNREDPQLPITYKVEWALTEQDLERYRLFAEIPCARVMTALELRLPSRTLELKTPVWMIGDKDLSGLDRAKDGQLLIFGQQIRRLLADARPFQQEHPIMPVAYLGASAELFPQQLRDRIFDARVSTSAQGRRRWSVFAEQGAALQAELGEGAWETVFVRATGRANLVYLRGDETIYLEQMGAGIQRLAALLAELCLAEEGTICMEEPEWKLSPDLQKRFVTVARKVVQAGVGPRQLFITTHSPSLAALGQPFSVELEAGVPIIEQKPWALSAEAGAGADAKEDAALEGLIGLVDNLAEMEPEQLVPGAAAATLAAPAPAAGGARPAWQPAGRG